MTTSPKIRSFYRSSFAPLRDALGKRRTPAGLYAGVVLLFFLPCLFPPVSLAGTGDWSFLPAEPLFEPLIGDLREPHEGLVAQTNQTRYEGAIGETIEILQWHPGDGTHWGWGISGASYIELDSVGNFVYPERISDWYLGTYFSQSSGALSHRLEYLHVSSHLGDELFSEVQRFVYTRESFRFTTSYEPDPSFRLYGGVGYYPHMAPEDNRFFAHAGTEIYSGFFPMPGGTSGRGYFTYDAKWKGEAGGVLDQTFEAGVQWKWKKDSHQAVRLAVLYYNGNSEYGQFYRQSDNHWGLGAFFDP